MQWPRVILPVKTELNLLLGGVTYFTNFKNVDLSVCV